jgi:hypothetical protein
MQQSALPTPVMIARIPRATLPGKSIKKRRVYGDRFILRRVLREPRAVAREEGITMRVRLDLSSRNS